jgi:hypothetical protein
VGVDNDFSIGGELWRRIPHTAARHVRMPELTTGKSRRIGQEKGGDVPLWDNWRRWDCCPDGRLELLGADGALDRCRMTCGIFRILDNKDYRCSLAA